MGDETKILSGSESRRPLRIRSSNFLIGLLVALILFAAVFIFGLRKIERAIAFHPERIKPGETWVAPAGSEDVWFVNRDGNRLHGWYFQSRAKPAKTTIIYFHGNGGNVSNVGWIGERLAARGFNTLLFDYRDYGRSEGELQDEQGLYADADAAYEYVTKQRGEPARTIVLYGQSLGTAAVADLASRRECAAIILESGMSSGSDVARVALPWLPQQLHFLAKNRFDSARKLSRIHCAVLITHGEPDQTILTEQGRALFAAANEPKKLMIYQGAGHSVFGTVGDEYLDVIDEFITNAVNSK
ncbi:MAG: alpha/beta hydrolase [Pyrinomonadaceae bacterium]